METEKLLWIDHESLLLCSLTLTKHTRLAYFKCEHIVLKLQCSKLQSSLNKFSSLVTK